MPDQYKIASCLHYIQATVMVKSKPVFKIGDSVTKNGGQAFNTCPPIGFVYQMNKQRRSRV
jgi:hypothetical protein